MSNQPIEEKCNWQEEFDSVYNDQFWIATEGKNDIRNETIKSFIENLLEQERKRMSDEIENLKIKDCSCSGRGDACSICGGLDYKVNRNNILSKCVAIINK